MDKNSGTKLSEKTLTYFKSNKGIVALQYDGSIRDIDGESRMGPTIPTLV